MPFNRIAVYGHRGWASAAIVQALADSGAPITVLHQPTSDTSMLPANILTRSVDVNDENSVIRALENIDIVISLVGHEGISRQLGFVRAIPKTSVGLFVPSDMSHEIDDQGLKIPVLALKRQVEEATTAAGIRMALVRPGYLVESSIRTPLLGIDYSGNRIIFSGDSQNQILPLCTLKYVAAAYASIFANTPISELSGRNFGISELAPTGNGIAEALEKKYGKRPVIFNHSLEQIDREIDLALEKGIPTAAVWYYRRLWGSGKLPELVGTDIWTVPSYSKLSLDDLIVKGKLETYRELPPPVLAGLLATFQ
ncbi:hypothetical protein NLG97_g5392 [Lecanicillium saksenae]|uniref:Uncharacterized protein n=1 Tax=Lecanicillium saksenae TaxID=468837 RepID=A0ACC1QWE9_9HYPO|nr:hypothetical protein NLG97_g5392 [Lecanicillium saksenae]